MLHVAPLDSNIHFEIDWLRYETVIAGEQSENNCINDNRFSSNDSAVGRISYLWNNDTIAFGTAFILSNGMMVTAANVLFHNYQGTHIVEFNVPTSNPNGSCGHPSPEHQYVIDTSTIKGSGANFHTGYDWAIFATEVNSITHLTPLEAQRKSYKFSNPPYQPSKVRIIGYGKSSTNTLNFSQQTSIDTFYATADDTLKYRAFTNDGVNGGPVIDDETGIVIGVHTDNKCQLLGSNMGTSFGENQDAWDDINNIPVTIMQGISYTDSLTGSSFIDMGKVFGFNIFHNQWDIIIPPKTLILKTLQNYIFWADSAIFKYQNDPRQFKFHDWNLTSFYSADNFSISEETRFLKSNLIETNGGVRIENGIIGIPEINSGEIEFMDPWLLDWHRPTVAYAWVNEGMNAPFNPHASPFSPDFSTHYDSIQYIYNGIFFDQGDHPGEPYYSVRVESTQTIGGYACVFDHWEKEGADVIPTESFDDGYAQAAIVFREPNAVVKAMYKRSMTVNVQTIANWNFLSVPLQVSSYLKDSVFTGSITGAYTYIDTGYVRHDTLKPGIGYWVKYATTPTIQFQGYSAPITSSTLSAGWHMIGSVGSPMATCRMKLSAGNITRYVYGTNSSGQYYITDTLVTGKAHWIKISDDATVILNPDSSCTSVVVPASAEGPPDFPPTPWAVTLSLPSQGATGVSLAPTVSWSQSDFASSYVVKRATDSNFTANVVTSSSMTTLNYAFSGLSQYTKYYWKVKAYNNQGEAWSSVKYFTTGGVPASSNLSSPSNNSQNLNLPITFSWSAVSGATSYFLYAQSKTTDMPVVSVDTITGTSYTAGYIPPADSFFWNVTAHNSFGNGDPTSNFAFSTPPGINLSVQSVTISGLKHPKLTWTSESGESNYEVHRYSCDYGAGDCQISGPIHATTSSTEYTDMSAIIPPNGTTPNVTYYYYVKKTTTSNKVHVNGRIEYKEGITGQDLPNETKLSQAYPNPFNPTTEIHYQLSMDSRVSLKVYNVLGKEVATLINGIQNAGFWSATFDASELPSGIYFYKLTVSSGTEQLYSETMKVLLAK